MQTKVCRSVMLLVCLLRLQRIPVSRRLLGNRASASHLARATGAKDREVSVFIDFVLGGGKKSGGIRAKPHPLFNMSRITTVYATIEHLDWLVVRVQKFNFVVVFFHSKRLLRM